MAFTNISPSTFYSAGNGKDQFVFGSEKESTLNFITNFNANEDRIVLTANAYNYIMSISTEYPNSIEINYTTAQNVRSKIVLLNLRYEDIEYNNIVVRTIEYTNNNDTINVNGSENLIFNTLGGKDTIAISNYAKNHTVNAGAGDDKINSENANGNTLNGDDGNDEINFHTNNSFNPNSTLTTEINGGKGYDTIEVQAADASVLAIDGGDDEDDIYFIGQNSVINGGDGDDLIELSTAVTSVNSIVNNEIHREYFVQNAINNKVNGGEGSDAVIVDAGSKNNEITGGGGDDLFVFKNKLPAFIRNEKEFYDGSKLEVVQGTNTITDFEVNNHNEKIDLQDFDETSFAELNISQDGEDTRITNAQGQTIILQGIVPSQLSADNFIFRIKGNDQNNVIDGGKYVGTIDGGAGNDRLTSQADETLFTGGSGNDKFIINFTEEGQVNEITDFEVNNHKEKIILNGFDVRNFEDLKSKISYEIVDGIPTAVITLSDKDYIFIDNVTKDSLTADNFSFGFINKNPEAQDISANLNRNKSLNLDVLSTATDADGDVLTISAVGAAAHGVASIVTDENGKQTIKYVADKDYVGQDKFSYTIADGFGGFVTKDVTVDVSMKFVDLSKLKYIPNVDFGFGINNDVAGANYYFGDNNDEVIIAANKSSLLSGGAGDDVLIGGTGNDIIIGGAGADSLVGGDGNDMLLLDDQDILVNGGNGFDIAFVNSNQGVNLQLAQANIEGAAGGSGNDTLDATGSLTSALIAGGAGDDNITGGSQNDALLGNDGNDILKGSIGADSLTGGSGQDQFIYSFANESNHLYGVDTITDFIQGEDKINLSDLNNITNAVESSWEASLIGNPMGYLLIPYLDSYLKTQGFYSFNQINKEGESTNVNSLVYHYDEASGNTVIESQDHQFQINVAGQIDFNNGDFIF